MDIKELIAENANAVKAFRGEIGELGSDIDSVKERLKSVEQKNGNGLAFPGSRWGMEGSGLAKRILESQSWKDFKEGNANAAKMTFNAPLLTKNTIVGDEGSPAQPSDTLTPATRLPGIVGGAFRQPRIRDLLRVLPTGSNNIEFCRENSWTNNAEPQAGEGETKAESDLTFELLERPVRTIAHFIKASKQSLEDAPALEAFIDDRMRHGVLMEEEDQLLSGDGTGANLSGLITEATAYDKGQTGDNLLDTLRRAIWQVAESDWQATGIVLNTEEWSEIELLKDSEGRYIFGRPGEQRPLIVWGLPVVASNSMPSGQFMVADFMNAAILWDRQQATVDIFEQDQDNVQRNLLTIRAEERVSLTVIRPAAIVHGTF